MRSDVGPLTKVLQALKTEAIGSGHVCALLLLATPKPGAPASWASIEISAKEWALADRQGILKRHLEPALVQVRQLVEQEGSQHSTS